MEAYLDNSATTKCADEVIKTVVKVMGEDYGNPSSKHMKGVEAEKYIKEARPKEAKTIQLYLRYEKLLIIVLLRTPS